MVVGGYKKVTVKGNEENYEFYNVLLVEAYSKPEVDSRYGVYAQEINIGVKRFNDFNIHDLCKSQVPVKLMYDQYKKPIIQNA
jgi:hypothetical protein